MSNEKERSVDESQQKLIISEELMHAAIHQAVMDGLTIVPDEIPLELGRQIIGKLLAERKNEMLMAALSEKDRQIAILSGDNSDKSE